MKFTFNNRLSVINRIVRNYQKTYPFSGKNFSTLLCFLFLFFSCTADDPKEVSLPSEVMDGDLVIDGTEMTYKDVELIVKGNVIVTNKGKLILDNCRLDVAGSYDEEFAISVLNGSILETKNKSRIMGREYQIGISSHDTSQISFSDTTVTNHLGIGAWDTSNITSTDSNIEEIQVHDRSVVILNGGEELYPVFFFDSQNGTLDGLKIDIEVDRIIEISDGWRIEFNGAVMNGYQIDAMGSSSIILKNCEGITASIHSSGTLASGEVTVSNVTTNGKASDGSYSGLGPTIAFSNTVISYFNIYTSGNDKIKIDGGTVNEANAMGNSQLTIVNSQVEYNLVQSYDTGTIKIESCTIEKNDDSYTPSATSSGDDGSGRGSVIEIKNSDCSNLNAQAIEYGKMRFSNVSNLNRNNLEIQDHGEIYIDNVRFLP